MSEPGPPEGVEPEDFYTRVDALTREGLPRITAVRIARREALGLHPQDQVRQRAAAEPRLKPGPGAAALREQMVKQNK